MSIEAMGAALSSGKIILDQIKKAVKLAQESDNITLNREILSLQSNVLELLEENYSLRRENQSIKENLHLQGEIEFRLNAYWKKDDSDKYPYCSACWDAKQKTSQANSSKQ